jgi:hypothetical protein
MSRLSGEGWDTDRAWAFWAGYKGPKGSRKVEWPASTMRRKASWITADHY